MQNRDECHELQVVQHANASRVLIFDLIKSLSLFAILAHNICMSGVISRLRKIRMLVLDVDGVLTDCKTYLDSDGHWKRFYSIRDGYGIKMLIDSGYKVGIITGTVAKDIQERRKALHIHYFYEGKLNKLPAFQNMLEEAQLDAEQVAYMGDDLFDLPVLQNAGFSATVPDAMDEVFPVVHYTTKRPAGNGAVREVCDLILKYGPLTRHFDQENVK